LDCSMVIVLNLIISRCKGAGRFLSLLNEFQSNTYDFQTTV
jgi:hypothetical protein